MYHNKNRISKIMRQYTVTHIVRISGVINNAVKIITTEYFICQMK